MGAAGVLVAADHVHLCNGGGLEERGTCGVRVDAHSVLHSVSDSLGPLHRVAERAKAITREVERVCP